MCSLKWLYSRRYPAELVSSALVFGSAIHAGLELYYQGLLEGETIKLPDMLESYTHEYADRDAGTIKYSAKESKDSLYETAERMFTAFLEQVKPGLVIAIEEPVEVRLSKDTPVLIGYIDLLEICHDEDGKEYLTIVDFKTSARKPSADSLLPDQLLLYHHAIVESGIAAQLGLPVKLRYDYLTKTKHPELISMPVPYSDASLDRVISKAKIICQGMSQELCIPNPGWMCAGCGYQTRCRQWPDGNDA
jgi:putative RecB family exonuclease